MNDDPPQHIKDFLDDDTFVRWVLTSHDEQQWRQFPDKYPHSAREFERAKRLVRDLYKAEEADSPILDRSLVWGRINNSLGAGDGGVARNFFNAYPPWQWAVGLILSMSVAWLAWQLQPAAPTTYRGLIAELGTGEVMIEKFNINDQPLVLALEDNSTVTLQKNSRLSYPAHFGPDQRAVVLTGEAFFEVSRESTRPFHVYTNEVVTTAFGEAFDVRAFGAERDVTVEVRQGRVTVHRLRNFSSRASPDGGLGVLPNQKVIFDRNSQTVDRRLVDNPQSVETEGNSAPAVYRQTPASVVLRRLEAQYGVTILFNDGLLDFCLLTITLEDEPLRDKLARVCRGIGANYREVDGQFVVESVGCR